MFEIEAFQATLDKAVSVFRKHGIRFHLTGGITSVAYGDPRMTQDLDMVIDNAQVTAALDGFAATIRESDFLLDEGTLRRAVADRQQFQLYDQVECLKIDVYPREMIAGELDRSAEEEIFEGRRYPLASRVDTILSKLVWINQGSHKGRRDLRYLYHETDEAQRAFVAEMAEQFGLTDLLAEVLAEPDEIR